MRLIKNKYRTILVVLGLFCLAGLVSCKKHNLEDPDNSTDRLFRPPMFAASVNANEVTLSWVPIADATYLLEISKDELQFENEVQQIELGETDTYVLEELWSSTRYSARIKAISKDPSIKESEFTAITFQTGAENIFYTPEEEDITINSVLLGWDKSKEADRITVAATGTATRTISLSATDIENGEILVDALNPATTYTFRIYKGEMLRGTLTVEVGALALAAPVFINFGMNNEASGWNNLTNYTQPFPHLNGTISDMVDMEGNTTGVSFVYATGFGSSAARFTTGPTATNISGFAMPDVVSQQGFYGVDAGGGVAVFRLEGLKSDVQYDLCFFASYPSGSGRETKYTVTGSNEVTTSIDPLANTSQLACANAVYPDTEGNIIITLTKGDNNTTSNGFYCINAMRLSLSK
ncbi:fibronectin type III domain-containing protein [Sphingobacterium sp. SGG-5]|uniref:fibronectin type III domain-containing protein n=1 Tax=Sphingobacterium sp. SGG-5 TaxID=2710881 RepID=UPI0013EA8783|nr:fibronectin type III domain-containing protein [Sphingobacterium sp. SGG-5]NGM62466.1 fibronectin type III domain-containing protein [Sphingobacterium sp. SGG-5]